MTQTLYTHPHNNIFTELDLHITLLVRHIVFHHNTPVSHYLKQNVIQTMHYTNDNIIFK